LRRAVVQAANGEMYCDRATNGSLYDDNFAGDAERIEKRNHVVTAPANIERAVHFFKLQYLRDFARGCASLQSLDDQGRFESNSPG
jgi:hypothetical protein